MTGDNTWPEIIFGILAFGGVSGMFLFIIILNSEWFERLQAKRAKRKRQAVAQAKRATAKRASGGRRRAVARTRRAAA